LIGRAWLISISVVVLSSIPSIAPVRADVKKLSVGIKGATCATCAFALRKAFKRLDNVEDAKLTTKLASMDVKMKAGTWPDLRRMLEMVRNTGFEAVASQVHVVATGTLTKQTEGWTLTLADMKTPTTIALVAGGGEAAPAKTFVDLQDGHLVEVDGTWKPPLDKTGHGSLRLTSLRRVTP